VFLSAALSSKFHRDRNLALTEGLIAVATVYLPQRDGGLLHDMIQSGVSWDEAAAIVKSRDIDALRQSDLVVAVLTNELVGAGVAFELGAADALGISCWGLILGDESRPQSPLIESALSRQFRTLEDLRLGVVELRKQRNRPKKDA
jgi:nucleoside 2-deoxyribosyltransferase